MTQIAIISIGGVPHYANNYEYHWGSWDYLYNSKSQTFWSINDGFGDPELMVAKVKDFNHLKEIITALNLD